MTNERLQHIFSCFTEYGPILRSTQLRSFGVCSKDIKQLLADQKIERIKEGYYVWREQLTSLPDEQIATALIPNATLCFLSAARIYDLTTIIPDVVYIAARNTGRAPVCPMFPPIQLTLYKEPLFSLGRTTEHVREASIPIYNRERTICDLIKRREEIGKDVVLESIKNYLRGQRDIQKLYTYAERMRVRHVLHPYVEALL